MARRGPLRMIRGEVWLPSSIPQMNAKHDLLECGHAQRPVTDRAGEVPSFRRRCGKCARGEARDYTPEQVEAINAQFPAFQYEEHKCIGCRKTIYYRKGDKIPEQVKCGDCLTWERARRRRGLSADFSAAADVKCSCLSNSEPKWHARHCPIYQRWNALQKIKEPNGELR